MRLGLRYRLPHGQRQLRALRRNSRQHNNRRSNRQRSPRHGLRQGVVRKRQGHGPPRRQRVRVKELGKSLEQERRRARAAA
jgi:hypothetical protein